MTTNAEGWRSPPVTPAPAPGALRVLALGDSFCFSWGVDDAHTVCAEVERALEARRDLGPVADVEVVNTGNGSWSGIDQLLTLKARGLALRPRAAFVLVCSNDFTDRPAWRDQVEALRGLGVEDPAALADLAATARERPPAQAPRGEPARTLYGLVSQTLNRSFFVVEGARLLRAWGSGPAAAPAGGPAAAPPPVDLEARLPYLREGTAALREVAATCRRADVRLAVFVIAPSALEVALAERLRADLPCPVVALDFPPDARRLVNSATDGHWNPEGTRHFGGRIAAGLVDVLRGGPSPR